MSQVGVSARPDGALAGRVFVAHNAGFDRRFLAAERGGTTLRELAALTGRRARPRRKRRAHPESRDEV